MVGKKMKRIIALLLVFMVFNTAAPALAAEPASESGSGIETFLSVINAWGTFLARITGSYDSLEHIGRFSEFARSWHGLIESEGFSPLTFFRAIMALFGVSIFSEPPLPSGGSGESYTL